MKKSKEDSIFLPDPFPLPVNYRPDIEVALKSGQMTRTTRAGFMSSVAAAMFAYKRFPTRDDYVSVARQIVTMYPFLGSSKLGNKYVS